MAAEEGRRGMPSEEEGLAFIELREAPGKMRKAGLFLQSGHPAKSDSKGKTSYGASKKTDHGSCPASTVYQELPVAGRHW